MKRLNKPELSLTLLYLSVSALLYFHESFLLLLKSYLTTTEISDIVFYLMPALVIVSSFAIYFAIKNIRLKLIKTNKQYQHLFQQNPIPMVILDLQTYKFIGVNKAALQCYGYTKEELYSMTLQDIRTDIKPVPVDKFKTAEGVFYTGEHCTHRKKDGKIIKVESWWQPVSFKNKESVLLLIRDITEILQVKEEKRQAEQEKLEQQNFTAHLLENFPVDVAIFNKSHQYILLNKTAIKNDEMRKWLIGKDDFDYCKRKGLDISVAIRRREKFIKAINGKSEEWIDEHEVNGTYKYILRKFFPYYENGELKYVYGYGMDISQIRKAEMQREEHMGQLEKIAFTTSHTIRTPICNLKGLLSIIKENKECQEHYHEFLEPMEICVNSMDHLNRELAIKLHEYKTGLATTSKTAKEDEEASQNEQVKQMTFSPATNQLKVNVAY